VSTLSAALIVTTLAGCTSNAPTSNTGNTVGSATPTGSSQMPPEPQYTGPVVATFEGGQLTKQELDKQYNLQVVLPGLEKQETKKAFINYYIAWYKYLYQEALKTPGFTYDPKKAQDMENQTVQQLLGTTYKTTDDVYAKLKELGLTQDDLLLISAKGEYLSAYLANQMKGVQVTDASAQAYYDKHKSDYLQVTVDHILVTSLEQGKKVESELKAGAEFAKTADKYSTDPGVKQNHGTYTDQLASTFVPEFAKAAETLPIGQISDPVHSQFGYHVMRVDKRTQLTFAQVKDQIQKQLLSQVQHDKVQAIQKDTGDAAKIHLTVSEADL
jgi:foldase protein PrsA